MPASRLPICFALLAAASGLSCPEGHRESEGECAASSIGASVEEEREDESLLVLHHARSRVAKHAGVELVRRDVSVPAPQDLTQEEANHSSNHSQPGFGYPGYGGPGYGGGFGGNPFGYRGYYGPGNYGYGGYFGPGPMGPGYDGYFGPWGPSGYGGYYDQRPPGYGRPRYGGYYGYGPYRGYYGFGPRGGGLALREAEGEGGGGSGPGHAGAEEEIVASKLQHTKPRDHPDEEIVASKLQHTKPRGLLHFGKSK